MASRAFRALFFISVAFGLAACKEEGNLFDEGSGSWALVAYDLTGGAEQLTAIGDARLDAFLLSFGGGGVALAACGDTDSGDFGVETSNCNNLGAFNKGWQCSCFAYEFKESTMRWAEYTPTDAGPPSLGAAEGEIQSISITEDPDVANRYRFQSLPEAVLQSNGMDSVHAFQQRADSLIDESGCRMTCGLD